MLGVVFSLALLQKAEAGVGPSKITPRLRHVLDESTPEQVHVAWVYLRRKNAAWKLQSQAPAHWVSERSLHRRAKVRPAGQLVDVTDLPVNESDVQRVARHVLRLRQRSKWLNAVSVEATTAQLTLLEGLDCVLRVDALLRYGRAPVPPQEEATRKVPGAPETAALDYGPSQTQLQLIGVPTLHAQGIAGQGVLVGHFDDGYRLLEHEVFASTQIVAAYDFVDHDPDPAPFEFAPTDFGAHGIVTLSVLGGTKPGDLVGVAYEAQYVLARTEDDGSETPIEEDNWIAAIEWADSIGIDVASTSLGYLTYDAPNPSWTWHDMDGNTTAITRAADLAVARGIVVVNSAGNEGFNGGHNTLIAPADGDSVIAVGAVAADGSRAAFSSVGPTTDSPGRIKPDVMALGVSVWRASPTDPAGYGLSSGTSLSCPLVAGVAALLLSAKPYLTPMQIRAALRATASQAASPDNQMGWGIVNAPAALDWLNSTDTAYLPAAAHSRLEANVPNPFNPATQLHYVLATEAAVTLRIYDVTGRRIRTLVDAKQLTGPHGVTWDGTDEAGRRVSAGVYACRFDVRSLAEGGEAPLTQVRKCVLLP